MGAADRLMPSLLSCSSLLEASGTQSQGRWGDCEYQATCTPPPPGRRHSACSLCVSEAGSLLSPTWWLPGMLAPAGPSAPLEGWLCCGAGGPGDPGVLTCVPALPKNSGLLCQFEARLSVESYGRCRGKFPWAPDPAIQDLEF